MAESPVEEQAIDVPAIEARETELEASASAARSVSGGASTTASVTDTPLAASPNSLNTTITLDEHEAATAKAAEVQTEIADEEKKRIHFEKGEDYEINTTTGFKYPINGSLSSIVQMEYNYDNLPAETVVDKVDQEWSIGVNYNW